MERIDISEVRNRLNSLIEEIDRQELRLVVEKSGSPVAAIVPLADLRRLIRLDDQMREAREVVEAMRAAFADVPDEEIERQTERIMAEIKEENRVARQRALKPA